MLEKYKGKEVIILVSSNSGAGATTKHVASGEYVAVSNIITVTGVIRDFDSKFLEITNSKLKYIDDFNTSVTGFTSTKQIESTVLESDRTLINIDKIISISIIK